MSNKEYLDTLRICGILKVNEKDYKILGESLLDISDIIKLYIRYEKEDRLRYIVYILSFVIKNIKDIDKLEIIYKELLNILEIGLKYNVISPSNQSMEERIYSEFGYIDIGESEFVYNKSLYIKCIKILKNLRVIHVREFDNVRITLDNIEYKVVAGRDNKVYFDNEERLLSLIKLKLDGMSVLDFDKDKMKENIMSILENRDNCIYIVRALYMSGWKG